jgi:hypothetical protein
VEPAGQLHSDLFYQQLAETAEEDKVELVVVLVVQEQYRVQQPDS